jgi:BirA family biotin operon repressor/biotin-[acetyl-CoA-carboxylase] ligase
MSLVLYTDLRNDQVWRVGIGACLSVIDTINGMFPGASRPKWPNDVVIGECKCAGVLVESGLAKGIEGGCVVGIGVNVLQPEFVDPSFPVQPISLAIAFGAEAIPSLDVMAREIANRMAARSERLSDNGAWHTSFVEWRETMLLGGQQTGMDIETGELVSGVLSDVRENDGAGVLVLADGRSRTVQPVSIQMPGRDLV